MALPKTTLVVGLSTLALIGLLEVGARSLVSPQAADDIEAMTNAAVSGESPPESVPSWATDDRCANVRPMSPDKIEPTRPPAVGDHLPQTMLGSYYSPLSLMFHEWRKNGFQPENASEVVAVFGASTIAGDGIPCSEYTLPSQLQRLLNREVPDTLRVRLGSAPRVDNLGQSAFGSYNQFLLLVNLLRFGYRPRLVIFYQGHTDALQHVMNAAPHFNYGGYAIGATGLFTFPYALRDTLLRHSALARLLSGERPRITIVEGVDHRPAIFSGTVADLTNELGIEERSSIAVADMLSEAVFVGRLARLYDFDFVIFNYPSVFSKSAPAKNEQSIIRIVRERAPAYEKAIILTQNKMDEAFATPIPGVNYRDMRGCFGLKQDAVFKDISHVTPRGNELLAECVAEALADLRVQ